jgi:hypothetical protein
MATVNFNLPSPYESELADIARRQKMADLMQQQAFQPAETFSYNGIQARTSPLTGIAKALQGYMAVKTQKDLINEQKALGEKAREQSMQEGTQFFNALRGAPANEGTAGVSEQKYTPSPFDIEDNPQLLTNLNPEQQAAVNMKQMPELTVPAQRGLPPQAARGPDYARALELASRSQFNPMVQSAGGAILTNMMKAPETAFGKVDAKDYTPESLRAFASGGGKDFSVLVPVRKQEFVDSTDPDTGRTVKIPVNPYAPPEKGIVQPMSGFIGELQNLGLLTPAMMQNPQVQNLLSGYLGKQTGQITPLELQRIQVDLARLRDQQINTQANTGMSAAVPTAPQPFSLFGQPPINASTVMNAPSAPRGAAPAPTVSPTAQQGIGLPADLSRTGLPINTQRKIQAELLTDQFKNQAAAKEVLPARIAQGQNMIDLVNRMVGTVNEKGEAITQPHAGINAVGSAIGRLGSFVPGSSGADFISMYNQVKGQSFLEAIEKMKGSGAISEIEGTKASQAINRMDVSQSREEFTRAAREFQKNMILGMEIAQKRAGGLSQGAQDALNAAMKGRR